MAARDLFLKALALPSDERARLAHELLVSLDEGSPEKGAAEAWDREIESRVQALRDGTAKTVPWAEARERIRSKLHKTAPRKRRAR